MLSFKNVSANQISYFFSKLSFYREKLTNREMTFLDIIQNHSVRDTCFDELLGIQTPLCFFKDSDKTLFGDGVDTIPTPYRIVTQMMTYLRPYQELSFMDVGCGHGRMLAALLTMNFKQLIGVEPNQKAIKILKNNLKVNVTRNQFTQVTLYEGDVLNQTLTQANIFYLYLPFYHETAKKFMEQLFNDYLKQRRPIILIMGGQITRDVKGYSEIFIKKTSIENFDIYHSPEVNFK